MLKCHTGFPALERMKESDLPVFERRKWSRVLEPKCLTFPDTDDLPSGNNLSPQILRWDIYVFFRVRTSLYACFLGSILQLHEEAACFETLLYSSLSRREPLIAQIRES